MPITSFSIQEIIPQLVAGSLRYVSETYDETNGLGGMAKESAPQIDPKIRIKGKVYKRHVATDIPAGQQADFIKDSRFTDQMLTAPTYGKGFTITINDLIQNPEYMTNFRDAQVTMRGVMALDGMLANGANQCISMIKRAENKQVKDILDTGVVQLSNYTDVDYGRDTNNSKEITTSTLKWTIANASTMKPYDDLDTAAEQIADRGNSGGAEMFAVLGRDAYKAYVNCDDYKSDSNQRRNYRVERVEGVSTMSNVNIPKGAVYRETILKGSVGLIHIFTYNQTFTNVSDASEQWVPDNKVYMIASDNIIERQPVDQMTFDVHARTALVKKALNAMPSTKGWLVTPEMNRTTSRSMAWGVYRNFLTLALTPNKTYALNTNP